MFVDVTLRVFFRAQLCCFGSGIKPSVYLLCSCLYVCLPISSINIRSHYVRHFVCILRKTLCKTLCLWTSLKIKTKLGKCLCLPLSLCFPILVSKLMTKHWKKATSRLIVVTDRAVSL